MTDLPFSKLYIDTRFKTTDSISNSDFKFQLRRPASMPQNATFCIDEVNIPNSWSTIETGINDKLYVGWQLNASAQLAYNILTIPTERYNGPELAAQIQMQLNAIAGGSTWTTVYDPTLNTLIFSSTATAFKIFTDDDLAITTAFVGLNKQDPQSINDLLQISGKYTGFINRSGVPFTTGFLNLIVNQDLYITSGNLGSFDSQGVRGESSIVRKVCVNASWGYSIIDKLGWDSGDMSCSKIALSTLEFQLRDVKGRIVPLHGGHITFSIRFKDN